MYEIGMDIKSPLRLHPTKNTTTKDMEKKASYDFDLDYALAQATAYASAHGIAMGTTGALFTHAPMTLIPRPIPRSEYSKAVKLAPIFGKLVSNISQDVKYLIDVHKHVLDGDPFTANLVKLCKHIYPELEDGEIDNDDDGDNDDKNGDKDKDGTEKKKRKRKSEPVYERQSLQLGILRSDYMLDKPNESHPNNSVLLQVELNTIASSFACLSAKVSQMHEFLLTRHLHDSMSVKKMLGLKDDELKKQNWLKNNLPANMAHKNLPKAMAVAVDAYWKKRMVAKAPNHSLVVFIVQEGELNSFDQRWLEYELWDTYKIRVIRRSLRQLSETAELREVLLSKSKKMKTRVLVMKSDELKSSKDAENESSKEKKDEEIETGAEGEIENADDDSEKKKKKRRTSSTTSKTAALAAAAQELESEIALVYFRAGYTPNDYPSQLEWDSRQMIEESYAIKCPSIAYHLAGTKKVQQDLANPGQVERFLSEKDSATIRQCFAGLWALGKSETGELKADDKESTEKPAEEADRATASSSSAAATKKGNEISNVSAEEAVKRALEKPEMFVLKPQREGGGNNYYGEGVRKALKEMSETELSAHILMQRIFPESSESILIRKGECSIGNVVSELGIYGAVLGDSDGGNPIHNEVCGHLLRTKLDGVDEGGVAAGFSCLDSPFLFDE